MKSEKAKKSISLKAHLWLYFCTFAIVIMLILWVLQSLLLGVFFNSMKLNELKKAGKIISEQYNLNDENFYQFWAEHSFNSGIFAQLLTDDGIYIQNSNNIPSFSDEKGVNNDFVKPPLSNKTLPDRNRIFIGKDEYSGIVQKIKDAPDSKVAFIEEPNGKRGAYGVYGAYLGTLNKKNIYLYLASPLQRTDTTRTVLSTQLLIASVLSIILALLIAYYIAKRLSKPIEEINSGAKRLAQRDYNVVFDEGSYREIDQLAKTLNYATGELVKTEELRRDLISNVSHDLRTPLTIIKSYAELIRDISGPSEEKRNLHTNIIIEEANNLSMLVSDMLDLSKIQSGTIPMDIKPFDAKELCETVIKRFDYYRETYGFVFNLASEGSCIALGDEKRIEQVVYNLVANAVNYTGDDKIVDVLISETSQKIRICVKDTGCGISDDEIDLVWDKYYKASGHRKREKVGTGIGLSIVKNILVQHNANFGVISKEGNGAEFWFELNK